MSEERISLEHGGGGEAMLKLIEEVFLRELTERGEGPVGLEELDDGAALEVGEGTLVFTTDSHAIKPLFFPGGDIGRLAVAGTVNDLAMMGGKPVAMASAMVLSEGFETRKLRKIVKSMNRTAKEAGVSLVTGDTKVVEKESLDGIIVTTTGVGISEHLKTDEGLKPGDRIIVTGNIGEHETAIIAHREGIEIGEGVESDVAPIWGMIDAGLEAGEITAMKDPTRGGLTGSLNELATKSQVGVSIREEDLPISEPVKNIGEMLGIDPLNLTNEGVAVIGVKDEDAESVLDAIRETKYGKNARIIGEVGDEHPGRVTLRTSVGGRRLLRKTVGAPTPRIC